jgi:hypothetical protein
MQTGGGPFEVRPGRHGLAPQAVPREATFRVIPLAQTHLPVLVLVHSPRADRWPIGATIDSTISEVYTLASI